MSREGAIKTAARTARSTGERPNRSHARRNVRQREGERRRVARYQKAQSSAARIQVS